MNDYRAYVECDYNSIYHHGIKGQEWGVRRFQNEDGTLTEEGKKRYRKQIQKGIRSMDSMKQKNKRNIALAGYNTAARRMNDGFIEEFNKNNYKKEWDGIKQEDLPKEYWDNYVNKYDKLFDDMQNRERARYLVDLAKKNKDFQDAYKTYKDYKLDEFDDYFKKYEETKAIADSYIKEYDDWGKKHAKPAIYYRIGGMS